MVPDIIFNPVISVIGAGHLGTTLAVTMAHQGFDVVGFDWDEDRTGRLGKGDLPFYEPGLKMMLDQARASGRLRWTTSLEEAAALADIHFLCIVAPQQPDGGAADLRMLYTAVDQLAAHLKRRCLVVGKASAPPGTAHSVEQRLLTLAPAGEDVQLAWSPQPIREGMAILDALKPDRLVFGVNSTWALKQLRAVHSPLLIQGTPAIVSDFATTELAYFAANAFLAVKTSFINAMAEMCEATGADVLRLADTLGHDSRIGCSFPNPGIGFSDRHLLNDLHVLQSLGEQLGLVATSALLHDVAYVNHHCRVRAVKLIKSALGGDLRGQRIAALGASLKPGSDDASNSPALDVADRLRQEEADVVVYDPMAMANAQHAHPELYFAPTLRAALQEADAILLLTGSQEFVELAPSTASNLTRRDIVIDCCNALDADQWRASGWKYHAIGRH